MSTSQCKECFHENICDREIGYGWCECPAFVPSADIVKIKRGKWTLNKDGSGTCSQCNRTQKNVWDYDNWQNYCGHCGAKMNI